MKKFFVGAFAATAILNMAPSAYAQAVPAVTVVSLELPAANALPAVCRAEAVAQDGFAACLVALGLPPGARISTAQLNALRELIIAEATERLGADNPALAALIASVNQQATEVLTGEATGAGPGGSGTPVGGGGSAVGGGGSAVGGGDGGDGTPVSPS